MRHFLALTAPIGALASRVEGGAAKAALVAPPRLTHALAPRVPPTPIFEAVHVAPVASPTDLHQLLAPYAGVDPVLAGGVHSRLGLPRSGQPNPFTPCSRSVRAVTRTTLQARRPGVLPGPSFIRAALTPIQPQPRRRQTRLEQLPPLALTAPSGTCSKSTPIRSPPTSPSEALPRYSPDSRGFQSPFTGDCPRTESCLSDDGWYRSTTTDLAMRGTSWGLVQSLSVSQSPRRASRCRDPGVRT